MTEPEQYADDEEEGGEDLDQRLLQEDEADTPHDDQGDMTEEEFQARYKDEIRQGGDEDGERKRTES